MAGMMSHSTAPDASLDAMIGGLGDPVFQTQRLFRSIMDAMARPGTIHPFGNRCTASCVHLSIDGSGVGDIGRCRLHRYGWKSISQATAPL